MKMSMQSNAQYVASVVKDRSPLYCYYYYYHDDDTFETLFVSYLGVPLQTFWEFKRGKITFN